MKILVVIPTLNDDPTCTIESILTQDIKVSQVLVGVGSYALYEKLISKLKQKIKIIYTKPDFNMSLGYRIAKSINQLFTKINLNDYDYLLRVDADTVLPPQFLSANLKNNSDLTGIFGFAMLLKVEPFIRVFNRQWPEFRSDDTFIVHAFLYHGCSIKNYIIKPKLKRASGAPYSWRYHFEAGVAMYKLGYEPLRTLAISLDPRKVASSKKFFVILGYLTALFNREEKFSFSKWIFSYQIKQFLNFMRLFASVRETFFEEIECASS